MGEKAAALLAAGLIIPILGWLIYLSIRNMLRSFGNVKDTVEQEMHRRRTLDADQLRRSESELANSRPPSPKPMASAPVAPVSVSSAPNAPASEMAAFFQESAKKSDDAHKRQIHDHVHRTVPPISPEGEEAIKLGRHARLAIKHIFPPRLPQRQMSYLGGLPIVPENFDWPTVHNRRGELERLNFMAQIDCADLPPGPGRELLPAAGYLYFFAPMSFNFDVDAHHFVARYLKGPATQRWEPLAMPFTGTIEPNDQMDMIWRGKRTHYDRTEVHFGWIEEPSDDDIAARADEGHAFEVAEKMRAELFDAFYGKPAEPSTLLSAHHAPRNAQWLPYPGFPANWKTARIVRKFIEAYHREEKADVTERLKALGEVAADNAELMRLQTVQRELSTFSSRMFEPFHPMTNSGLKEYDAPPEDVKKNFLNFLEAVRAYGMPSSKDRPYSHLKLPSVLNRWLEIAAIQGAEGGLNDPTGAAHIPPEVVTALAHRHDARKHHMLGEGAVVQVAANEMQDRYLLLLQLGPDRVLDWMAGEMGPLQYWITPEDLAAKRFENTILTIESY